MFRIRAIAVYGAWTLTPRELTAGGKNCQSAFSGLPGYPGALAMEADGTLYISYRWARSGWLEKNADSTLLRGHRPAGGSESAGKAVRPAVRRALRGRW